MISICSVVKVVDFYRVFVKILMHEKNVCIYIFSLVLGMKRCETFVEVTRKYQLRGYCLASSDAAKEDNVVERSLSRKISSYFSGEILKCEKVPAARALSSPSRAAKEDKIVHRIMLVKCDTRMK